MPDRDQRLALVILWLFALMNYIYGDIAMIFSLFSHPEQLERLRQGLTAGGKENLYFLGGAAFMNIAFLMLPVSWFARQRIARWANFVAGIIFTAAMAAILLAPLGRGRMPPINYYSLFAVIEIIATMTIVWRSWNWRPAAVS
jgi:hypothetical protein